MLRQSVISYAGGMDQDTARDAYPPNKYYAANNLRLLTKNGLSTGDLASEPGNTYSFEYPSVTYGIYQLSFDTATLAQVTDSRVVVNIGNAQGHMDSFSFGDGWDPPTINLVYDELVALLVNHIAAKLVSVIKYGDHINVIGYDRPIEVFAQYCSGLVSSQRTFVYRGSIVIRDIALIFTSSTSVNGSAGSYQIWKLNTTNSGYTITDLVSNKLVPSKHLIYNSPDLALSALYKVRGLGNYETPDIVKIYFTDMVANLRHMNVMDSNLIGYPVEHFDIVPAVTFGTITIGDVEGGGNYKAGMVQYAYCLFNVNGSQTTYSPVSPLVHLTGSTESGMSTDYLGSPLDTLVNKAVNVTISSIDQDFDYIRVVALHYNSVTATPDINIVKEIRIPESGTVSFVDGGNSYGIVTYSEFTTIGTVNFMCKAMEAKENILFAANITQDFFDVTDWDSRAYRFTSQDLAVFDGDPVRIVSTFEHEDGTPIALNADCIQKDAYGLGCKFNLDHNIGGEGPNIKYELVLTSIPIDDYGSVDPARLGVDLDGGSGYALAGTQADYTGYQRFETYRFAIIFENTKGQFSFAKWIADIKMPYAHDSEPTKTTYVNGGVNKTDYVTFYKDAITGKVMANALGVKFYVKNLPTDAVGYKIVRCKREDWDKTIVTQGLWNKLTRDTNFTFPLHLGLDTGYTISGRADGCLISPEISFYKNLKMQSEDYIQVVGIMDSASISVAGPNDFTGVYKFTNFTPAYDNSDYHDEYPVEDVKVAGPGWAARFMVGDTVYANYVFSPTDENVSWYYHATGLFFNLSAIIPVIDWPASGGRMDFLVNYCRDISQYGGNSYDARLYNQYIPCSSLLTTVNTFNAVYSGDTIIEYFDCMLQPCDVDGVAGGPGNETDYALAIYLPVETSINLALRTDKPFSKREGEVGRAYLSETAGVHGTLTQSSDMYLYNTAYSKQSESQVYTVRPAELSDNEVFDARIYAGLTKVAGELIDKWTTFLPDNRIDVDGRYGSINALLNWEDKLVFMQDTGWGAVSVNEKILTMPDETGQALTLGKGGILDDFRYVSTRTGCVSSDHVFVGGITKDVIYYIDAINNNLMLYTATGQYYAKNETAPLSVMKGIMSYMNNLKSDDYITKTDQITGTGMSITYYPDARRIMFNFTKTEYAMVSTISLAFNEIGQIFEGTFDYASQVNLAIQNAYYSMQPDGNRMFVNGTGDDGNFFGSNKTYNIDFVLNPNPLSSNSFTNAEYNLTMKDENGVDLPFTNFADMRLFNDYQDSGLIPLVYGVNSRRRFRIWRCDLPRNAGGNLDRVRSQAARLQFRFWNNGQTKISFVLEPMTIKFVPNDV